MKRSRRTNLSCVETSVFRFRKNVSLARNVQSLSIELVDLSTQPSNDFLHLSRGNLHPKLVSLTSKSAIRFHHIAYPKTCV